MIAEMLMIDFLVSEARFKRSNALAVARGKKKEKWEQPDAADHL